MCQILRRSVQAALSYKKPSTFFRHMVACNIEKFPNSLPKNQSVARQYGHNRVWLYLLDNSGLFSTSKYITYWTQWSVAYPRICLTLCVHCFQPSQCQVVHCFHKHQRLTTLHSTTNYISRPCQFRDLSLLNNLNLWINRLTIMLTITFLKCVVIYYVPFYH